MMKKLTLEDFIKRSTKVHNGFYDYSQSEYTGIHEKIKIICPKHGEFYQKASNHMHGTKCKKCSLENKTLTNQDFIKRANEVHNNFYDYSQVEYKNIDTKIKIICPNHGVFLQTPYGHLYGYGCSKCSVQSKTLSQQDFVDQAIKVHNNFYDYSETIYIHSLKKLKIICPIHGEFYQRAEAHLKGHGCRKCSAESRTLSQEEFEKRANEVHNNFYDYSQSDYKCFRKKIKIICPIHGDFFQSPPSHLNGNGCRKCSYNITTNDEFKEKANEVHNNFYDYSQINYKDSITKIKIICPIHGEFLQIPNTHLRGSRCYECVLEDKRMTNDEFKEKANEVHNNFYDYSHSDYKDNQTKVKIICPTHGEFLQIPNTHLKGGGCYKCALENRRLTQFEFIRRSNIIHNNFYDYSQSEYKNSITKIKIICPTHGEFFQCANNHLQGSRCYKCSVENRTFSQQDFIDQANKIHNNFYDYSQCEYINYKDKIKIICPLHGVFFQSPSSHLAGHGCSKCCFSKGEKEIEKYLKNNNILYETEKMFDECIGQRRLPFDFYLPQYNTCIEYDGRQHFIEINYWGGKERLEYTKINDQIKTDYCLKNNIKLLRIPYTDFDRIEEILKEHLPLDISKTSL